MHMKHLQLFPATCPVIFAHIGWYNLQQYVHSTHNVPSTAFSNSISIQQLWQHNTATSGSSSSMSSGFNAQHSMCFHEPLLKQYRSTFPELSSHASHSCWGCGFGCSDSHTVYAGFSNLINCLFQLQWITITSYIFCFFLNSLGFIWIRAIPFNVIFFLSCLQQFAWCSQLWQWFIFLQFTRPQPSTIISWY